MIVLVTRTTEAQADLLVERLNAHHAEVLRLNWDDFPRRIRVQVDFADDGWHARFNLPLGRTLDCDAITAGYCRRAPSANVSPDITPHLAHEIAVEESETTIQGVLSLLIDRYWMNHPHHISIAYSKILQFKLAHELGFTLPRTRITNDQDAFSKFQGSVQGRKITKLIGIPWTLAENGYLLFTSELDREALADTVNVALCPTLIQEFVPKDAELRVTVVGDEVFAMEIQSRSIAKTTTDWRRASLVELRQIASPGKIPATEAHRCVALLRALRLEYGAFDFIRTPSGEHVFLEVNPHGAWGFVETLTDLPISDAIARHLIRGHSASHSMGSRERIT